MKRTILMLCLLMLALSSYTQIQKVYDITKAENQYIYQDKFVKLFIKDKIFIQTFPEKDTLKKFIVVPEITDKSNTISISFTIEDFGGTNAAILKLNNPFNRQLSYKAKIKNPKTKKYEETNVLAIYPHIFSMEEWPDNIESIILYDFILK